MGVTARGKKLKSSNLTGACSEWNVASRNADPQLTGDGRRIGLQIQIHDRETNFGQKMDERSKCVDNPWTNVNKGGHKKGIKWGKR